MEEDCTKFSHLQLCTLFFPQSLFWNYWYMQETSIKAKYRKTTERQNFIQSLVHSGFVAFKVI